jgi:hypothetical protein
MAQMFRDSRLAGTNDRITAVAIGDDECRGGTQVEG